MRTRAVPFQDHGALAPRRARRARRSTRSATMPRPPQQCAGAAALNASWRSRIEREHAADVSRRRSGPPARSAAARARAPLHRGRAARRSSSIALPRGRHPAAETLAERYRVRGTQGLDRRAGYAGAAIASRALVVDEEHAAPRRADAAAGASRSRRRPARRGARIASALTERGRTPRARRHSRRRRHRRRLDDGAACGSRAPARGSAAALR